jgi:sugar O-acyltransferase (sialic acid O-acetyltransferase NeuD family)
MSIEPVYVPCETVNDDRYIVTSLPVSSGATVVRGQIIAEIETSKATLQIESPASGYFFTRLQEGKEVMVGALLALICDTSTVSAEAFQKYEAAPEGAIDAPPIEAGESGLRVSNAAASLIAEHRIELGSFSGLKLVRREDVEKVLRERRGAAEPVAQPPAVSEMVHRVHTEARVVIVGGGGHARMCIDLLRSMKTYEIAGIVDPELAIGANVLGVEVIGRDSELSGLLSAGIRFAVIGLGAVRAPREREVAFARVKQAGFLVPNLIHPSAVVEPSAVLGEGNQIMAHATVGSAARIGNNCIVNTGAIVAHDCVLEDNVHVSPGGILAGGVTVGDSTLIGMGATVYLGVRLGRRVVVANGLDVFADVPDRAVLRHEGEHRRGGRR